MLNEIVQEIAELLRKQRPETITQKEYGRYGSREVDLLYCDNEGNYKKLTSVPDEKDVGSVKAFAACIKEELRRKENLTGNNATVRIYSQGGYFIPDDNFGTFKTTYNRIKGNKGLPHREGSVLVLPNVSAFAAQLSGSGRT